MKHESNIERTEMLRNGLMPLYDQLMDDVRNSDCEMEFYYIQCGENFPAKRNCGLMFVGRDAHSWGKSSERIMKAVSKHFYTDSWNSSIAYTHVCKAVPARATLSRALYKAQKSTGFLIFDMEKFLLAPKLVVLLTGPNWSYELLTYLNLGTLPNEIDHEAWNDYECEMFVIGETIFICTEMPEGKPTSEHWKALIRLIDRYNLADRDCHNE